MTILKTKSLLIDFFGQIGIRDPEKSSGRRWPPKIYIFSEWAVHWQVGMDLFYIIMERPLESPFQYR